MKGQSVHEQKEYSTGCRQEPVIPCFLQRQQPRAQRIDGIRTTNQEMDCRQWLIRGNQENPEEQLRTKIEISGNVFMGEQVLETAETGQFRLKYMEEPEPRVKP